MRLSCPYVYLRTCPCGKKANFCAEGNHFSPGRLPRLGELGLTKSEMIPSKVSQGATRKPATILCIDDEEPGLLVRKALLESAGHRVLTALSGREGLRLFSSESVDAVIVDYWMAGKNGLAVARELKRINRATPIIMLSAYVALPDETIGVVDLWVQKGGDSQYLLNSLEKLLKSCASRVTEGKRSSA